MSMPPITELPTGLAPMGARYVRPDWVRRVNAMGDACGGAHHVVPFDLEELVGTAVASVGLDDFGNLGDGDWLTRLRNLLGAVDAARLHVVGRLMTREELLRGLRTRLLLAEQWRRQPGIAAERIVAPVVITGPARSGTSILFELLALDPGLRGPTAADVLHPAAAEGVDGAARLRMAECEQELWADVQPEFAAMHELRSDLPVECITITSPSFAGAHWSMVLNDPGDWAPDPVADFAFHRAVLQTLQHGRPPRPWVLKTPGHLVMLDALYDAYPDARVILTHRDPARTMPSTVSTAAMVQWLRTDHVELDQFAPLVGAIFGGALNDVAVRHRDGRLPPQFGDVAFTQLVVDPVAAIATAYAGIGLEMADGHADAVRAYVAAKPKGKFGVHRYTAQDWGFDPGQLHRELATYLGVFSVRLED